MMRSVLVLLLWPLVVTAQDASRVVVFDIDGTLTPNVIAFWHARDAAALAATTYAQAGVEVVYLSARVSFLQANVPDWLADNGFPQGEVHLMSSQQDRAETAAFKTGVLQDIQRDGTEIVAAYGDSSSDFEAYAAAGIPQNRVFALRRFGRRSCRPGVWQICYDGWSAHLPLIDGLLAN